MIDPLIGLALLGFSLLLEAAISAARSALVHSRPAELQRLEDEQISAAARANAIAAESTRYLISLRLGLGIVRLVSIGLALASYSGIVVADGGLLGLAIALAATGLLMTVVEFMAENLAMRQPERWAIRLAPFVGVVVGVLAPLGGLTLRLAGEVAGSQNGPLHPMITEEEIMTLVDAGEEGGSIEQDEKDMIFSIFRLDDTLAREVMIPRIDMLALDEGTPIKTATDTMLQTGYSRAPVFRESIDNIIGMVYVKDLLSAWREGGQGSLIGEMLREAYFVPEAKKVDDLLQEMQARRFHLAIVVDEYGGTAGLVTIEDIVEEIVGEIRDEYDFAEEASYRRGEDGEFIFSGGIDLDDVNQIAGSELPKQAGETLGGFIYSELGRVPSPGDSVESGGLELVVDQVVRRRIRRVRARKLTSEGNTEPNSSLRSQENGQADVS
jgi:CBS domain containing-hemolysin-like protein